MLLYVLLKFVAESAWCLIGLTRLLRPEADPRVTSALTFALVRLLVARVAAFLVVSLASGLSGPLVYVVVLIPIRWLTYGLTAELMAKRRIRLGNLLLGDAPSNRWRIGGLLVSSLADFPGFLAGLSAVELWP